MDIAVLCGGISTEREVSISSGTMVCAALRRKNHNAILLDAYMGTEDKDIFEKAGNTYDVEMESDNIRSMSDKAWELKKSGREFFGENVIEICKKADIVFLALHGKYGEDGMCQAALDLYGIKYTGSGYLASTIGMDKGVTKQIFQARNVPTAKSAWIKKGDNTDLSQMGLKVPVVVKACNGGSSVGVVIVQEESEYEDALKQCFQYDDQVLVEEFISGREFSVGVIDGEALPIVEIMPVDGWYDYENKYKAGATNEVCPAQLDDRLTKKMQETAVEAYNAIGCEAYARVDVMMDLEENMYCLEVNTLPGMTATSLVPQEAKVIGMDFDTLCQHLIDVSLKKYD